MSLKAALKKMRKAMTGGELTVDRWTETREKRRELNDWRARTADGTRVSDKPTLLMLEDGKAYLRDGEQPGSAELVFFTEDGRCKAHPLTPAEVRKWAAKLTEIAARVG